MSTNESDDIHIQIEYTCFMSKLESSIIHFVVVKIHIMTTIMK